MASNRIKNVFTFCFNYRNSFFANTPIQLKVVCFVTPPITVKYLCSFAVYDSKNVITTLKHLSHLMNTGSAGYWHIGRLLK